MKKNFMKVAFAAAFAVVAGYGVYANQKADAMPDLALNNVEALADWEIEIGVICVTSCNNCWCYYGEDDLWVDGEPWQG